MTITRRNLILIAGSGLLTTGCGAFSQYIAIAKSFRAVTQGDEGYPRSLERIKALPYAQLGVKFGDGPRGIMVLSEIKAYSQIWVSGNEIVMTTQSGRIVQTLGIPVDITKSKALDRDPLQSYRPGEAISLQRHRREMTFIPLGPTQAEADSIFKVVGEETIQILDQQIRCLHVIEDYQIPSLVWSATNHYWLGLDIPIVWKSYQSLHPDVPTVQLEILKRPA